MKKKLLSIILMVALVLTMTVSVVACNKDKGEAVTAAAEAFRKAHINETHNTASYDLLGEFTYEKVTYPITWSSDKDTVKFVPAADGKTVKVTVTKTTEDQTYKLIATLTDGEGNTATAEFKGTIEKLVVTEEWGTLQTIKYEKTNTTTMAVDINHASKFGVDPTMFAVFGDEVDSGSYKNPIGLNKDGTIRLYHNKSGSNTLTIGIKEGYYITRVTVTLTYGVGTADKSAGAKLQINGGDVIDAHQQATLDPVVVNSGSVVLKNATTEEASIQVWIVKIDIEYKEGTAPNGGYVTFPGEAQPPVTTGEGTEASPYTVADAAAIAAYYDGDKSPEVYGIGYVTSVSYSEEYNNYEIMIADSADAQGTVKIYRGKLMDGETTVPGVGDKLLIKGQLKKFNSDLEYDTPTFKVTEVAPAVKIGETGYATIDAAIEAAQANDTIVLNKNIVVTTNIVVGKKITLDLNGKTISNTADIWNGTTKVWSLVSVRENGELTITGNGKLDAKADDCFAVDVREGGKVIIENGEFVGNLHSVYVLAGSAEIKGGKYSIKQLSDGEGMARYRFTLNLQDANGAEGTATITVTGGQFVNYNPAASASENPVVNFVAEGYVSTSKTEGEGESQVTIWTVTAVAKEGGTATLKYTGTTSTNIGKSDSDEELLGLDAKIFTVTSSSNYSDNTKGNKAGLNKDGTIRLYVGEKTSSNPDVFSDNGCSLTITVAEGYVIKNITVKAKAQKETVLMKIGDGEAITLEPTSSENTVTVNDTSITIQNVNTTNVQLWIESIVIVYDVAAAE